MGGSEAAGAGRGWGHCGNGIWSQIFGQRYRVVRGAAWLGRLAIMSVAGVLAGLNRQDHGALAQDLVVSFSPLPLIAVGVVVSGAV